MGELTFKRVCKICQKEVKGSSMEHLEKEHKPNEFFVMVPEWEW